jgi:hypothetical protein
MEDGEALHSESAESNMNSQGYYPFAEEATNIPVFPQKRSAESNMSSQGSDSPVRKKIKRTNDDDSSESQQAQSKNADTKYTICICIFA